MGPRAIASTTPRRYKLHIVASLELTTSGARIAVSTERPSVRLGASTEAKPERRLWLAADERIDQPRPRP
ncbi:hypothetical protein HMPREF0970_01717 [Schaalia odontolytica F0309]|uniref:Uncharacterized protein n=1 Tax=Schaalia odontolytica F0309 TaxID=649742 RepID=D4U0H4_9ACTO|nr:hypothetical protein HMPREF0970_01717 [Schaalia odontolytica F0309]